MATQLADIAVVPAEWSCSVDVVSLGRTRVSNGDDFRWKYGVMAPMAHAGFSADGDNGAYERSNGPAFCRRSDHSRKKRPKVYDVVDDDGE
ncbi:Hypothetical protein NTJ_00156 [Nesidiocoris tenuis]|uniref:Uncharacterized protein n=1 Tax=Nesidiocoris tenuis TaxID=355587 RepID=A0ABN7A7Y4_9HEMI|nr:Hypothetical protein NTJ_00156 [Nesidiocoris tenuis]